MSFNRTGRSVLLAGVLLLALITGTARAVEENVTVGFGVDAGAGLLTDYSIASPAAACQLSVASGADGFDVLDAAVAQGCIVSYSYSTNHYQGADYSYVQCIDGVCGRTYFHQYNPLVGHIQPRSSWSSPVLELFSASSGSEFVARYDALCNC